MIACAGAFAVVAVLLWRGGAAAPVIIGLVVVAAAAVGYGWRFGIYPRIVVTDDEVQIRNPVHTIVLPLDQVRAVAPGENGLKIATDARTVEAWCVQKPVRAIRSGRSTRADEVAAQVTARLVRDGAATPTPSPTASSPEPTTAPGPTAAPEPTDLPEPTVTASTLVRSPAPPAAVTTPVVTAPIVTPVLTPPGRTSPALTPPALSTPASCDPTPPTSGSARWLSTRPLTLTAAVADDRPPPRHAAQPPIGDDGADGPPDDPADEPELIIRRAHADEAELLTRLEGDANLAALAHVFPPDRFEFPSGDVHARWVTTLADRRVRIRIAEVDGAPIGFIAFGNGQIRHLGVLPDTTRRGHGTALVEYAVADQRRAGHDPVWLWVLQRNTAAQEFYRRLGFVATGDAAASEFPPFPVEIKMILADTAR